MSSATRYHSFSQFLHWAIAGLIVLQFILANLAEGAADSGSALRELALLANHKSVGITVLALVIVRLMWRVKKPPPALPATMDQWQILASHISHWALYGLIILIPVSGWLMSSASAYSVSWFNLFQLPDFVAPDPGLKELFKETHELLGKLLFVVAVVH
ncbi:MAG: cytochrome b, partial [Proteobacteria bacterium]|nr:cytochrome b [Pseudomonadota bacterium]